MLDTAKSLYLLHHDYSFAWFNRESYKRKCRRLAKLISRKAGGGTDESFSMMYLDVISLRCGFQINQWRD